MWSWTYVISFDTDGINHSHLTLNCFQLVLVFTASNWWWYLPLPIGVGIYRFQLVLVFTVSQPNTFSKYETDRSLFWNEAASC